MTGPAMDQPTEALWQDYAFLTHELAKFASRQEWDMVLNLLEQREAMQKRIDARADREFASTEQGRTLFGEIMREEQAISQKIRQSRNQAQAQQKVAKAYDAYSAIPAGSLMNRGT